MWLTTVELGAFSVYVRSPKKEIERYGYIVSEEETPVSLLLVRKEGTDKVFERKSTPEDTLE